MKFAVSASLVLAALLTPTSSGAQSATIASGKKSQITTHFRADKECNAIPIVIEIVAAPANGTVTSEPKDIIIPAQTPRGGKQGSKCVGKTVKGVTIFYQPNPGFSGQDNFRYRRTSEAPGDRSSGEINYSVTVK
jgi:hypothetical protein